MYYTNDMKVFEKEDLKKLFIPDWNSKNEDNGSVTIIGGSSLFHGAPILSLKAASRLVDMVYFSSPEPSIGEVAAKIKSSLSSFIWVPWDEVEAYIEKSDAVLIGPGLMRFTHEKKDLKNEELNDLENNTAGKVTRSITEKLLLKYPNKKWVIDAGSLQVMDKSWIPPQSIITPNSKEFEMLFKINMSEANESVMSLKAKENNCIIVAKGPVTLVASPTDVTEIRGGNPGLTKGGSGDILAGLTVSLLTKNDPFLAACAASYLVKAAADRLYQRVGTNYNSDDLADIISETFKDALK